MAAVLASLGMAWLLEAYSDGNHSDLFEAAVLLLRGGGNGPREAAVC